MSTRAVVASFVVALALNGALLWLYYTPEPKFLIGDELRYGRLIAFGSPADRLIWPPLYPSFVGMASSLFGPYRISVQGIQIVLWLATAAMLWRIGEAVLRWKRARIALLGFALFFPELMAFSHYLWPETLHLFFFVAALYLFVNHADFPLTPPACGLLLGLALLTKLVLLPFVPVLLLFYYLGCDAVPARKLARISLCALVLLATIGPTVAGNVRRTGQWVIADSSVFNLWVGINDRERCDYCSPTTGLELRRYVASAPSPAERRTIYLDMIRTKVAEQGLLGTLARQLSVQYFRLFDKETFFASQLPGGPRHTYRFDLPFLARSLRACAFTAHALLLVTAAVGLCCLRWRRLGWLHCFALFIVYNLVLFLGLHVTTRYTLQFFPLMMPFASVTVCWLLLPRAERSAFGDEHFVYDGPRLATGLVVAALLLAFAFLGHRTGA
jgi:hypothetical protein